MKNRSRSTLFLMEQIVVILVFAICAAACARIFIGSYMVAAQNRDTRNSLVLAESAAECFKASGGDLTATVKALGAKAAGGADIAEVYYNKNREITSKDRAYYILSLSCGADGETSTLSKGHITVFDSDGMELFSLPVAARRRQ